jgi:cyclohexyl-isocyanide hydratase
MIESIAFLAYPWINILDLVGGYDSLRRLPGVECRVIGTAEEVGYKTGLRLKLDGVLEPLDDFDLLYVPGGLTADELTGDAQTIDYLRSWGRERPIVSVCNGAMLLGAAGHLEGRRATTHHAWYDALAPYCREVVRGARLVDDGRVVTAAGVTAALDLGLHLVRRYWSAEEADRIAAWIEYDPVTRSPE